MPHKNWENLSIRKYLANRLGEIGKGLNPPLKKAALIHKILSDYVNRHDQKVIAS